MHPGDMLTTAIIAIFSALFLLAFVWAVRSGQLQEIEQVKFKLFEADDEADIETRD